MVLSSTLEYEQFFNHPVSSEFGLDFLGFGFCYRQPRTLVQFAALSILFRRVLFGAAVAVAAVDAFAPTAGFFGKPAVAPRAAALQGVVGVAECGFCTACLSNMS